MKKNKIPKPYIGVFEVILVILRVPVYLVIIEFSGLFWSYWSFWGYLGYFRDS
jgi:hypothetical protein